MFAFTSFSASGLINSSNIWTCARRVISFFSNLGSIFLVQSLQFHESLEFDFAGIGLLERFLVIQAKDSIFFHLRFPSLSVLVDCPLLRPSSAAE
jgi:hypothetical protein